MNQQSLRAGGTLAVIALAMIATSCATRSAIVGHRMLLPEVGARHEVAPTQFFVMPIALASAEPVFPEITGAVEAIEITVCAEIWLSAEGNITRVAPFHDTEECADIRPTASPYQQSVSEALQRWEFTPAMICEFPPQALDKRERGDCTGPEVEVRRVPVRLDYAFTFSSRDGRRRVGIARRPRNAAVRSDPATR
jgi:hypothetical protein